jgi:hypothetical protein
VAGAKFPVGLQIRSAKMISLLFTGIFQTRVPGIFPFLYILSQVAQSFQYPIIITVIMKLLLLLVAIHSLIFYQRYKIEKSNTSVPGANGVLKTERPYQRPGLPEQDQGNADLLIRSNYAGYRYSFTGKSPMTGLFSYE